MGAYDGARGAPLRDFSGGGVGPGGGVGYVGMGSCGRASNV